jgi:hypothetical protein
MRLPLLPALLCRWSVDTSDPYPDGMVQVGTKLYRYHDALARIAY